MGIFDKFLKAVGFEDEDYEREPKEKVKKEKKQEIPSAKFNLKDQKTEEKTYFPTNQSELEQIVKHFVKSDSIVVDFSKFENEKRENAISFVSGAAFALGGAVKKVGETTYLLSR